MVFSAGNDGPAAGTSVSPANYPESFAVGSVGNSFFVQGTDISDFSGRGPAACGTGTYPDVVAPGYVRTTDDLFDLPDQYVSVSGTSFSAPHLAGVMALLLGAGGAPGTPPATLYQILRDSATDLGAPGPDNDYGYGLVNALAAFELLNLPPQLEVLDPVPPVDDLNIDFGEIVVGNSVNQDLTLRNVGGGTLTIAGLDLTALSAPFTIVSDLCTGMNLDTGQDCTLRISFAPAASGNFQGSFLIHSNDALSPAQVLIAGQGVGTVAAPQLTLSDNTGAGGDALVEFAQVPPGTSAVALVTVGNAAGAGPLQVESLATADLPAIYSLEFASSAPCDPLPKTLLAGQSCTIQVRYAPVAAGSSAGRFSIQSNDPVASGLIGVSGFSNTPPPAAQLQSPADGSSGQSTSPTLTWLQQPDTEGTQVSNTVQIATNPHFIDPTSIPVASLFGSGSGLLLGSCGFAALLLPLGLRKRKQRLILLTMGVAVGLLILVSCGGGGGATDPNLRSQQVSGLASGTTYYWRVLSDDGQGGMSLSEEFSFTTR